MLMQLAVMCSSPMVSGQDIDVSRFPSEKQLHEGGKQYIEERFSSGLPIVLAGKLLEGKRKVVTVEKISLDENPKSDNYIVGVLEVDSVIFSSINLSSINVWLFNLSKNRNPERVKIPVFWLSGLDRLVSGAGSRNFVVEYCFELDAFRIDTDLQSEIELMSRSELEGLVKKRYEFQRHWYETHMRNGN